MHIRLINGESFVFYIIFIQWKYQKRINQTDNRNIILCWIIVDERETLLTYWLLTLFFDNIQFRVVLIIKRDIVYFNTFTYGVKRLLILLIMSILYYYYISEKMCVWCHVHCLKLQAATRTFIYVKVCSYLVRLYVIL